jgi:hypothetical protein
VKLPKFRDGLVEWLVLIKRWRPLSSGVGGGAITPNSEPTNPVRRVFGAGVTEHVCLEQWVTLGCGT